MGVISLLEYKQKNCKEYYAIDLKKCTDSECFKNQARRSLLFSFCNGSGDSSTVKKNHIPTCMMFNKDCPASYLLSEGSKIQIEKFCIEELKIHKQYLLLFSQEEVYNQAIAEWDELYDTLLT